MQSGKIITLSVWLMITFNLIIAFGAVWSFQRMSPEIRRVYQRNVVSLNACENMLLAMTGGSPDEQGFRQALSAAENNITERGEKEMLSQIRQELPAWSKGDPAAAETIVQNIRALSDCNKQAIIASAEKTQRLRQTGAWGIVFMTFFFIIAALFFEQRLRRSLLLPLKELDDVLDAGRKGDTFRRCNENLDLSADMKRLFRSVNDLLDSRNRKP